MIDRTLDGRTCLLDWKPCFVRPFFRRTYVISGPFKRRPFFQERLKRIPERYKQPKWNINVKPWKNLGCDNIWKYFCFFSFLFLFFDILTSIVNEKKANQNGDLKS